MKNIIFGFFLFSIIIFTLISFSIKINSDDKIELSNQLKLLSELSIINGCCKESRPINCSRSYTYVNYDIKKKSINNTNNETYYTLYKTNYLHAFSIRKSNILIAVHCHISLFYHRYVFRKIYSIYKNIQLLFFVGLDKNETVNNELQKEIQKNKDIVLFNFYCDYYKLCLLTYNFLMWLKEYHHSYNIIIKQDTDTFLNIALVNDLINKKIKTNQSYVIGKIWNIRNKNKEYASGMSYIFPSKSVNKLIYNINKKIYNIKCSYEEDMLFGLLSRKENFIFLDSFYSFHYTAYQDIPKFRFNINRTLMIHTLRISEIAFLHYITIKKTKSDIYILNATCSLHN